MERLFPLMYIGIFVQSVIIVIILVVKMENSYPCVCGHSKNLHYDNDFVSGCAKRIGWGIRGTRWVDDCREFKPDNLKYLEQKYDKRAKRL